jgi:hypothetical protein
LLSQCVCAIIYGGIHQGSRKHKSKKDKAPPPFGRSFEIATGFQYLYV